MCFILFYIFLFVYTKLMYCIQCSTSIWYTQKITYKWLYGIHIFYYIWFDMGLFESPIAAWRITTCHPHLSDLQMADQGACMVMKLIFLPLVYLHAIVLLNLRHHRMTKSTSVCTKQRVAWCYALYLRGWRWHGDTQKLSPVRNAYQQTRDIRPILLIPSRSDTDCYFTPNSKQNTLWAYFDWTLSHRLRCWANIKPTLIALTGGGCLIT